MLFRVAYNTSGNSANILNALSESRERGLFRIGFTGNRGGSMCELCDIVFDVPSSKAPRIQEGYMLLGHVILGLVEQEIFKVPR
jgi:D-sedoheptulose 7-phosphate isomerase